MQNTLKMSIHRDHNPKFSPAALIIYFLYIIYTIIIYKKYIPYSFRYIAPPLSIVELHVEHPKLSCRTPQAKLTTIVEQIWRIVEHFRDPISRIVELGQS